MKTIYAMDLVPYPEYRRLWLSHSKIRTPEKDRYKHLPKKGFVSPAGFYLYPEKSRSKEPKYTITFLKKESDIFSTTEKEAGLYSGRSILKVSLGKEADKKVSLVIAPTQANVIVDPRYWDKISEAVILIVTQCWRFYAIEKAFSEVSELSHEDLTRASTFKLRDWKYSKRYLEHDLKIRALSQHIPHFEGISTDPYRHCTDAKSAEFFHTLAEKLDMEGWCSSINDRMEVLQETYEVITDKFFHHQHFIWTLVIEIMIVVILLVDLYALFVRR